MYAELRLVFPLNANLKSFNNFYEPLCINYPRLVKIKIRFLEL